MEDFFLGLLGSGLDFMFGSIQQERQNRFNASQAELNRNFQRSERESTQDWNLAQWNRENIYNSPKQQLQRLLEAGFNPNTALNNVSNVSPGSVRTTPQSGATATGVGMFNTNFGSAFQRYNESKLLNAQVKNIEETTSGLKTDNRNKQRVYDDEHSLSVQELENAKKVAKQYDLNISISEIQLSADQANLDFILDSFATRLEQLRQELANSQQQGEILQKQEELLQEQIDTENIEQTGKQYENQMKKAQAEAENLATEIFETTGIRPTDSTTSVFAKAYELQLKGKPEEAKKLLEEYGNYLRKVRDNSQYPTLDSVGANILQPASASFRNAVDSLFNRPIKNYIPRPVRSDSLPYGYGTHSMYPAGWPRFPNFR